MLSDRLTFIFLLIFSFSGTIIKAQNVTSIAGIILNESNEPVPFSTIALVNADSVLLKAEQSNMDGAFIFNGISEGNYIVQIRNIEYQPLTVNVDQVQNNERRNLGVITMKPSTVQLDELVIHGQKPLIEIQPGKTVYNVESDVSNVGIDGLSLLGKAPGIMIDPDNNIVYQGRTGVRVFINGRPSRLSGPDLVNMLQSMPSDNIKSIELITNPSAKYEAEGSTGIIDIILKKNTDEGTTGSVFGNFTQGTYLRYNAGLNLNYKKGKVNVFGNLNHGISNYQQDFNDYSLQNGFEITLSNPGFSTNITNGYNLGLDYFISENHFLGFSFSGNLTDREIEKTAYSEISTTADDQLLEILISKNNQHFDRQFLQNSVVYEYNPEAGGSLSFDASMGYFGSVGETDQPNTYYQPDGETLITERNYEDDRDSGINIYAIKLDYEKSIGELSLSLGSKYSDVVTDNAFDFFSVENSNRIKDIERSNDFRYSEKVFALYSMINTDISSNWKLNAGLRFEQTFSLGELTSELPTADNEVKRSYGNIFPTAAITYSKEDNSFLMDFSYGRRVSRPNYQNLNPFEMRLSELSVMKGNPFLNPSFTDTYQVSTSIKQTLTANVGYSKETDYVAMVQQITGEKSNMLRPENMQNIETFFSSVSLPINLTDWWEIRTSANLSRIQYTGMFNDFSVDIQNYLYNVSVQNSFNIGKNLRANFNAFYNGPSVWRGSIEIDDYYSFSFGVSYSLLNDRLQVSVTGSDILNSASDLNYLQDYGGLFNKGVYSMDAHRFGGGLTFKFGNQKAKRSRKSDSAIDEEMQRIQ